MKKTYVFFILLLFTTAAHASGRFQKLFGGLDVAAGTAVLNLQNGFLLAGYTNNFGAGSEDAYLIRIDADGDTLWTKTYGSTFSEAAQDVRQTSDGGFIVAGNTIDVSTGNSDILLIKTDSVGSVSWIKRFGTPLYDESYSVAQTTNGGYVVAGYTTGFSGGSHADAFIVRTDANGDTTWTRAFGGASEDYGWVAVEANDGGFVLSGSTESFGAGGFDMFAIKTDSNGAVVWSNTYGGSNVDFNFSVVKTFDGGFVLCGHTINFGAGDGDMCIIKLDENGNVVWTKTYGGTDGDVANSIQQTADSGYLVGGYTRSFGAGVSDYYLVKADSAGNLTWSKSFGGSLNDECVTASETSDGGYIASGYSYSFSGATLTNFVVKTDGNGFSGCNESSPVSIVNSPTMPSTAFTPVIHSGFGVLIPSVATSYGAAITTLCTITGLNELQNNSGVLYPNPVSSTLNITHEMKINSAEIFDVLGQKKLVSFPESEQSFYTVDVSELSSGIYFLRLKGDSTETTYKFVKE